MWDNINLIVNKRRPSSSIEKLQHDGKQYHQPFSISNVLNKYFRDIPFYLASKLPKSNCHFTSYLQQKKSSFCLKTVNEVEVFQLLENLDGKKSFAVDKLHPYLASIAAFEIFRPITYTIILSLKQCMCPDKIAKAIPNFKQDSRDSCDNYRPISVLPVLS